MINQLQVLKNVIYTINGIHKLWMFMIGFFILQGCSNDDDSVILSTDKQITSFQFEASRNTALETDIIAVLDQSNKTITATVPFDTNITALKATISQSTEASVSPSYKLEQNFSNPITYTVTAQDGTLQTYEVIVKVTKPSTDREILIAFFNANPNHKLGWDLKDETMDSWEGVTHDNGKVIRLNLVDKNITTIPSYFGNLTSLTFVNLNTNKLASIPIEIGKLTQLTVLNLSENDIQELPKEIGSLSKLTSLNLYSNELISIPAEIGNLTNLNILYLKLNRLASIPIEIGRLTKLTDLNLSNTSLTSIPAEIGELTNLTTLSIGYNNRLSSIPKEIGKLIKLTAINAYGSGLTNIPKEIGNLTDLTSLSLGSNAITSIPVEISNLTKLDYLALTDNNLTSIPKAVCDLETNYGTTVLKDTTVNCI